MLARTLCAAAAALALAASPATASSGGSSSSCVLQCQDAVKPAAQLCAAEETPEWQQACRDKLLAGYHACLDACPRDANDNGDDKAADQDSETAPEEANEDGFWPAEPAPAEDPEDGFGPDEPFPDNAPADVDGAAEPGLVPEEAVDPMCVRGCSVHLGTCYQACGGEVHCTNDCSKTYEKCTHDCFHEVGLADGGLDTDGYAPAEGDEAYPLAPDTDAGADADGSWEDAALAPEERLMEEEAEVMDDIFTGAGNCINECESSLGACLETLAEGAEVAACEDPMRQCLASCLAAPPAPASGEEPAYDEEDGDAVEYYPEQDGDGAVEYYPEQDGDEAVEYYPEEEGDQFEYQPVEEESGEFEYQPVEEESGEFEYQPVEEEGDEFEYQPVEDEALESLETNALP